MIVGLPSDASLHSGSAVPCGDLGTVLAAAPPSPIEPMVSRFSHASGTIAVRCGSGENCAGWVVVVVTAQPSGFLPNSQAMAKLAPCVQEVGCERARLRGDFVPGLLLFSRGLPTWSGSAIPKLCSVILPIPHVMDIRANDTNDNIRILWQWEAGV